MTPTTTDPRTVLSLLDALGTTLMLARHEKRVTIQQLTAGAWSTSRGRVQGSSITADGPPSKTETLADALQQAADWLATD